MQTARTVPSGLALTIALLVQVMAASAGNSDISASSTYCNTLRDGSAQALPGVEEFLNFGYSVFLGTTPYEQRQENSIVYPIFNWMGGGDCEKTDSNDQSIKWWIYPSISTGLSIGSVGVECQKDEQLASSFAASSQESFDLQSKSASKGTGLEIDIGVPGISIPIQTSSQFQHSKTSAEYEKVATAGYTTSYFAEILGYLYSATIMSDTDAELATSGGAAFDDVFKAHLQALYSDSGLSDSAIHSFFNKHGTHVYSSAKFGASVRKAFYFTDDWSEQDMASFQQSEKSASYDGVFFQASNEQYQDSAENTFEETNLMYFNGAQIRSGSLGSNCIDDDNTDLFDVWPINYGLTPIWELPLETIMDSDEAAAATKGALEAFVTNVFLAGDACGPGCLLNSDDLTWTMPSPTSAPTISPTEMGVCSSKECAYDSKPTCPAGHNEDMKWSCHVSDGGCCFLWAGPCRRCCDTPSAFAEFGDPSTCVLES